MTTNTDTEQERAELLPCPFCGGEAFMEEHPPHKHSDWLVKMGMPEYSAGSFTIECVACECGMIHESRDGVVAAWNRRAALQSQDREDAERYRWLRDGGNDDIGVVMGFDCIDDGSTSVAPTYREGLDGEHLDAAIDHARRVEGEAK